MNNKNGFSESHGCNTTIKLENLQNHVDRCIFNPNMEITCEKGCGLKIIKKDYDNHNCTAHLANLVIKFFFFVIHARLIFSLKSITCKLPSDFNTSCLVI